MELRHHIEVTLFYRMKLSKPTCFISQVLADVIYMPGLRVHIMDALRSPQRSDVLTKRVGEMFGQA